MGYVTEIVDRETMRTQARRPSRNDELVAAIPANGQVLKVTFGDRHEAQKVAHSFYAAISYAKRNRKKFSAYTNIYFASRGLTLFLWRDLGGNDGTG